MKDPRFEENLGVALQRLREDPQGHALFVGGRPTNFSVKIRGHWRAQFWYSTDPATYRKSEAGRAVVAVFFTRWISHAQHMRMTPLLQSRGIPWVDCGRQLSQATEQVEEILFSAEQKMGSSPILRAEESPVVPAQTAESGQGLSKEEVEYLLALASGEIRSAEELIASFQQQRDGLGQQLEGLAREFQAREAGMKAEIARLARLAEEERAGRMRVVEQARVFKDIADADAQELLAHVESLARELMELRRRNRR
jgi:hypothetical protein